ncbi:MAG: MBL fold metallo-hydrolase [Candidatus Brocadiia bacterium]
MFEKDTVQTSEGELEITFVGHGTLMFQFDGKTIHVDPVSREADYSRMPDADVILVTHEHGDHLDPEAIAHVRTDGTQVVGPPKCAGQIDGALAMKAGDERVVQGLPVEAVPAYNIRHKRDSGAPFHPRGDGVGYVVGFGDVRVYVAGDTENIPEMAELEDIDIAFLPMNLPYTMTPEMGRDAALMFRPRILYPYHYGQTDPAELAELLEGEGIEVRVRQLQ